VAGSREGIFIRGILAGVPPCRLATIWPAAGRVSLVGAQDATVPVFDTTTLHA